MDLINLMSNFKSFAGQEIGSAIESALPGLVERLLSKGTASLQSNSEAEIIPGLSMCKALDLILGQLQPTFPGLTLEAVLRGEIPLATVVLEQELQKWATSQEGVEAIALSSEPERFRVTLATKKGLLRHEATLNIEALEFEYSKNLRLAKFRCQGDPEVKGLNFLGSLFITLAEAAILKALQSAELKGTLQSKSAGALALQWPEACVDLGKVEALQSIANYQVCGFGLLDLLTFGPLKIESDRVVIKVGFAAPRHS